VDLFIGQDTHSRLRGDPRQRGVSGAVWGNVCCRETAGLLWVGTRDSYTTQIVNINP